MPPEQFVNFNSFNSNINVRNFSGDRILIDIDGLGDQWSIDMHKGKIFAGEIIPGVYTNAVVDRGNQTVPSLGFRGGLNCAARSFAEFTIYEIEYGNLLEVNRLVADFKIVCQSENRVVKGSIVHDTSLPEPIFLAPPPPISPPIPPLPTSQENALIVQSSDAAEPLGAGQRYSYSNSNAIFSMSTFDEIIRIEVRDNISNRRLWNIAFDKGRLKIDPNRDTPLREGVYENAFDSFSSNASPYLDIVGFTQSCRSSGSFNIHEIQYDMDGQLESIVADFTHTCDSNTQSELRASLRYIKP